MICAEGLLPDRQSALVQPFRLSVLTLLPVHEAEFVECSSVGCMIGSEACLHEPLKLLCIELGGGVVAARVMILKGLFDRLDVGWLGRCGRKCSKRRECKDRDKSDRLAAPSRYHDLPMRLSQADGPFTPEIWRKQHHRLLIRARWLSHRHSLQLRRLSAWTCDMRHIERAFFRATSPADGT